MFRFKSPSEKTLEIMSEVAKGNVDGNFEESCIKKIRDLTTKDHVRMTSSANNSIFIALSSVTGDVIIPDQGGWHGFKQIAKFLNLLQSFVGTILWVALTIFVGLYNKYGNGNESSCRNQSEVNAQQSIIDTISTGNDTTKYIINNQ